MRASETPARMRAVNERLGYRYGLVSIRFESPLPLCLPERGLP
jgi:hypothetical protein